MTITTTHLTRAAGVSAVAAGLLFIAVQIKHPHLTVDLVTTTQWTVRQSMKVCMAALALAGITGMYLSRLKRMGVLGLLGYVVFSVGYLTMLGVEFVGGFALPSLAHSAPAYVDDVLAVAGGGHPTGDIGLLQTAISVMGVGYLGGGLIFGIALLRAGVLARWAAALLALGSVSTVLIPLLPQVNERLFAIPNGVALVGLGHSLWQTQRTQAALPVPSAAGSHLDPAGAR